MTMLLDGFSGHSFTHDGVRHPYYRLGEGPAVIVITEIPGITPKVIEFARRVADAGCTVYLPSLFGTDGASPVPDGITDLPRVGVTMGKALAKVCVSREFTIFALGKSSPVVTWLRALAAQAHAECGGPGVGAVGMCVSGGFALAMAVDERMLAPVLSQPSLPFGITASRRRTIDISPEDLETVKIRCARGLEVLGTRFKEDKEKGLRGDWLVPNQRFQFLRDQLGSAFIDASLPAGFANPDALIPPHSVLTEHLIDEPGQPTRNTLDQVIEFFRTKLGVAPAS